VAALGEVLGQPVTFADDLLDGKRPDDGTQVAREDPSDQLLHALLLGQKPARRIGDRSRIVTNFERGYRLGVQLDALDGDAVRDDLRDVQCQPTSCSPCG
jgi:hypothetical protein